MSALTVLHVAPHPDDEAIAAPATLLALRRAGHRVVNLACSLGRPAQRVRRREEVEEGCRRLDVELVVHEPPLAISRDDDRAAARTALAATLAQLIAARDVRLVVAPSPHDPHHGHQTVARATLDAAAAAARPPRLWLWDVWGSLALPTLYVPFGDDLLAAALHALTAHAGELARARYDDLVRGRSLASVAIGSERVFGLGERGRPGRYAELLTELERSGDEWWAGSPRTLDAVMPLASVPRERPLGWWLAAPTFAERLARACPDRRSGFA